MSDGDGFVMTYLYNFSNRRLQYQENVERIILNFKIMAKSNKLF
jgi:hypothetical protein